VDNEGHHVVITTTISVYRLFREWRGMQWNAMDKNVDVVNLWSLWPDSRGLPAVISGFNPTSCTHHEPVYIFVTNHLVLTGHTATTSWTSRGSIPARAGDFSLLQMGQTASGVHPFSYSISDCVTFIPGFHKKSRENTGTILYFHKEQKYKVFKRQ
jgi:hypothetical protein